MLKSLYQFFPHSSSPSRAWCWLRDCVLGHIAQVHLGLYKARTNSSAAFSFTAAAVRIPHSHFSRGYLLGTVLLINLLCAHVRYYQPGKRKIASC